MTGYGASSRQIAAPAQRMALRSDPDGSLSKLYFVHFGQVQVEMTPSFAMNSRASPSGRMTPLMSPISSHLRLGDQ